MSKNPGCPGPMDGASAPFHYSERPAPTYWRYPPGSIETCGHLFGGSSGGKRAMKLRPRLLWLRIATEVQSGMLLAPSKPGVSRRAEAVARSHTASARQRQATACDCRGTARSDHKS